MLKKILFLIAFIGTKVFCQNHNFYSSQEDWDHPAVIYKKTITPEQFKTEDVIIINDLTDFNLINSYKSIKRTVLLKINTDKGLQSFNAITLPESFDIADNVELWQQGRLSRNKIPFIYEYNINYFLSRIIKPNGKIINLPLKNSASKIRWIKSSGDFMDDYTTTFKFENLAVGDLLEFSYQADYTSAYGSNILYLCSKWPKVNCNYSFKYAALPEFKTNKFIYEGNIADSCIKRSYDGNEDGVTIISEKIKLKNVKRTNYFIHSLPAKQLPHVYFNMYYKVISFKQGSYAIAHPPNFEWLHIIDTTKDDTKFHTKHATGVRKFVNSIPVFENDSDHVRFFKAVCDTLNSYKYYSMNDMVYNNPVLVNISTGDHLQKRRISELFVGKIYEDILDEKDIFYYITSIQDKRLGEHSQFNRVHAAYENAIVSVPTKNSYIYFVPRLNGLKYHLNELPFYYEGALAALFPINFRKDEKAATGKYFKFIKTHYGTDNENVRVENCLVKIKNDSLKAHLDIKENLTGQFSTVVRPLYLKDFIDSTINAVYFKKCTDKPYSSNAKIKLSSKLTEYPFRYVFNCSENITLKSRAELNLTNWFSFVFNKNVFPEVPTNDFYFDFPLSDAYNFIFEFDTPVTVTNTTELTKNLTNDWFEITSSLTKQNDNTYLLSVMTKVKKEMLPKEEAQKFMEFVNELDNINRFVIKYTK